MNDLMRRCDIMDFMKISRSTLWRLSQDENFPKPVLLMGMMRWRRAELESWLSARQEEATGEVSTEC